MYVTLSEALTKGGGIWRSFTCPNHDDRSPSARVNSVTGKWVCMVCGSKGKSDAYEVPEHLVIKRVRMLDASPTELSESYLDLYDSSGPGEYWSQRFTPEACKHFRLGYDSTKDKSLYPLRDTTGQLLGLVYRSYTGDPKYKYPRGVPTSQLLFNYHEIECRTPVVVVEGAPDVIALWEVGVPAVGTFGARLLPGQQRLLSALQPTKVVMAYDQDRAGRTGAREAVTALSASGLVAQRAYWSGAKDPGELEPTQRRKIFEKYLGSA